MAAADGTMDHSDLALTQAGFLIRLFDII